jgi:hypothetical protein
MRTVQDESGIALLISILLLLMMSAIAISAVENSGEESAMGGRMRRTVKTLHAADGGMQIGLGRMSNDIYDGFSGTTGDGTSYQSGDRTQTSAQPAIRLGYGPPPDGNCIGVGATCFRSDLARQTVSSFAPDGAVAEIEAQVAILRPGTGGYQ